MDDRLRELGAHVRRLRRPQHLDLGSQSDLARKAKIGPRKVSDVERGVRAGAKTYDALETVLRFEPGSMLRYLREGGELPIPASVERAVPEPTASGEPVHEWSAETRRRMIEMTMPEVLQRLREEEEAHGEEAAEWLMGEITRVREEARASKTNVDA